MLSFLKNHPFAVEAFFKSSLVLTFAVPKEKLMALIPECLELDTLHDRWAFIALAMVQTTELRPKGFPKALGHEFFLIGYRIFVKYHTRAGKRWRGLYILKSQTDKKKMEFFGNLFTHYRYTTTDIEYREQGNAGEVRSAGSGLRVTYDTGNEPVALPKDSPFADWKEARKFAGPLPFTFTYAKETREVLIIEGVREHWQPMPVQVSHYAVPYLEELGLKEAVLANAFVIKDIPYHWKKGKTEPWKP